MSAIELPRLSDGGTIVCLAPGPSLTTEDCEWVRGRAVVIAVNDAIRLAPWADVLYSSDSIWWQRNQKISFSGLKVRVCPGRWVQGDKRRQAHMSDGVLWLRNTGERGLELERDALRTYKNSGASAINLAVHLGAKRIPLLGYDMAPDKKGRKHFHDTKAVPNNSPYPMFRKLTATMVEPLKEAGIEVINCSRVTALECFPRMALADVLLENAA